MGYADPAKQRLYQAAQIRARREEWIARQGGTCSRCGSTERLEVDHIDPAQKEIHTRNLWSRRKEVREAELAKCQVLCKVCHDAKTYDGLGGHGTPSRYEKGCRCALCTEAHATKNRQWRARRHTRDVR